jgi:predicted RNA-binding Zn ribbon-like protein
VKPLLLGGHRALEFLNTTMLVRGAPVELIGNGRAFLEWLVDAGFLDAASAARMRRRFGAAALDAVAEEARELRTWAIDWLSRWRAAPFERYDEELRTLNALLARANDVRVLRRDGDRLTLTLELRGSSPDELIGLLARELAELVTTEDPSLVKRCAGADCTLWFVDRTKSHRRRYCSPTACGNREKVAAFRERQRERSS